jgi:hypothetical protein
MYVGDETEYGMRFEVLIAVNLDITVFLNLTPYDLVGRLL